ncbi:MAG: SDR family oxidoreductase [Actinomycetota bacterium]|nr:SDR family oxidoreductase [Actinomycetota bacterium]
MPATTMPPHVAIVTGANHGIGAAVAERLAADGARVLITYLRGRVADDEATPERYQQNRMTDGDEVVARIVAAGGAAIAVEADLLDDATPTRLFDLAEAELGPVDIVVNNATGWASGDSFAADTRDPVGRATPGVSAALFDRTFGVDARAGALMIAEFSARLIARDGQWGRIVGLTSGSPEGFPSEVTYGAAKAALENYTMSAAFELGRRGVTANMIHPPITDSGWVNDAVREFAATARDHFHVAEPADVAEVIGWLCSDAARMVSGNIIRMR